MDLKKILRNDSSAQSIVQNSSTQAKAANVNKTGINQYQQQESRQVFSEGSDTVTISERSRQLSRVSQILERDQIARDEKIAALKEKVQNGLYKVDSRDLARSIISFAADSELEV